MVYVFLAEGFELVEALAPVDILRRAGAEVQLVGVEGREVAASNGVTVRTDCTAQETLDYCVKEGKLIGAICAAPSILAHKGLLKGREATAFPKFQQDLIEGGASLSKEYVCQDGQFITGRGMGVSTEFGLALAAALVSSEKAEEIKASIQKP